MTDHEHTAGGPAGCAWCQLLTPPTGLRSVEYAQGKPRPPDPPYRWWWRLRDTLWSWITWPWQVALMKREGFRRVGWMSWEVTPLSPAEDAAAQRRAGLLPLAPDEPARYFHDPDPIYPWAQPDADVIGDIRRLAWAAEHLPERRHLELRCTGDVLQALQAMQRRARYLQSPSLVTGTGTILPLTSEVHIIEDPDLDPGTWQLWENGKLTRSGSL